MNFSEVQEFVCCGSKAFCSIRKRTLFNIYVFRRRKGPFLWGQNEGTIAGNTQYIIFGSAFKNQLKGSPAQGN